MLFFVACMGGLFTWSFIYTIYCIVHKPQRYLLPSLITSLLGAYLVALVIDTIDLIT